MSDKKTENAELQNAPVDPQNAPAIAIEGDAPIGGLEVSLLGEIASGLTIAESFGNLNELKRGKINLKSNYLSFDGLEGQEKRLSFIAISERETMNDEGEKRTVPCAILFDQQTGTIYTAMQTVLVGILRETKYPKGHPLCIIYKGEVKIQGSNGKRYQDFDVYELTK